MQKLGSKHNFHRLGSRTAVATSNSLN